MNYFDILFAKANGVSESSCYNEIETMLKTTVGHSNKNVFEVTAETATSRGVTFTVNKQAGTVTTSGTATGGSAIFVMNIPSGLSGDFYFSGCAEGGTSSTFYIEGRDLTTNSKLPSWDGGNSVNCYEPYQSRQITIPQGHECALRIIIARNVNADGLVFRPMIRYGQIKDNSLEPYVTPTDEKKQDKPVVLWEATLNSTGVSEVPISSLTDNISNYSYLKVVVTNELNTTITDQDAVTTVAEYDTAYIGKDVVTSNAMLGIHSENGALVFDRLFIWVSSEGTNITVRGLRNHNDTSTPPDVVPNVFIRKIIGIPK